eukprot:TRINITY_DN4249_c0_g1_i1.p1 TRINITY_DN4249_c0_g1~~TRINITY_DN4249_c0_g1_i1.p1  ORF type:complete len:128 (-),score=11.66 TRINITY_DN4249_c0_g1_i1:440-823(-)
MIKSRARQEQPKTVGRQRRVVTPFRRDGGQQLVKALQKAEAQLDKPTIGTITNLVLPAQSCFLKVTQKGCPQVTIPVCAINSNKEYSNCCHAVRAGESKFIRGRCNYDTTKPGQQGKEQFQKHLQKQ